MLEKTLKLPRPFLPRSQRLGNADRTGIRVGEGDSEVGGETYGAMGICVSSKNQHHEPKPRLVFWPSKVQAESSFSSPFLGLTHKQEPDTETV